MSDPVEPADSSATSLEYPPALTGGLPIVVTWEGWWTNGVLGLALRRRPLIAFGESGVDGFDPRS
jgi:hypothetical protein